MWLRIVHDVRLTSVACLLGILATVATSFPVLDRLQNTHHDSPLAVAAIPSANAPAPSALARAPAGEYVSPTPATATPLAAVTSSPTSGPCATGTGPFAGSTVTVCPARGPVGTTVTLTGVRCANPGQSYASFLFGRNTAGAGGSGAVSIYAPADGETARTTFVIPRVLNPYQGGPAGQLMPATYAFRSVPNYCTVAFELTAR